MAGIADVLYVRFRVADLAKQRDFLIDFGFVVEEADGLLLARGTDPNPYVYIAEEGDPAFRGIGFEAQSQGDLERIAAIDRAPIDDSTLPGDEVVEIFIDPDGDEITYYEFEFSPLNVTYDLFNFIPSPPMDFNPSAPFVGLADWDARGVQSAVKIDGTLDEVADWEPSSPLDKDRSLTVEIAIPWSVFRTTTTPHNTSIVTLPPQPGQRWRMGLYRVERPRVAPQDGRALDRRDAQAYTQLQAWSPTHLRGYHKPERFGVVEFVDRR